MQPNAVPIGKRRSTLNDALLHFFKDLVGNDGLVIVTHEILWQFAAVGAVDLAEMVNAILLLQQQVALILFVAQNRMNDAFVLCSR